MANFKPSVLTAKGTALMQKAIAGETDIKFTKMKCGDGTYAEGEDLTGLTDLKSTKGTFPFSSVTKEDGATVILKSVITNQGVQTGYYVKEIGIFAQDPDEGEILYCVAVAVNGQWDYLPPFSGASPNIITVNTKVIVSNANVVYIDPGQGVYVTADQLNEHVDREVTHAAGVHGIRYNSEGFLEVNVDNEWIKASASIEVDSELSLESENPLQNKVTTKVLKDQEKLIDKNTASLLSMAIALSILTGSKIAGLDDNIVVVTFGSDDGVMVIKGVIDRDNKVIYA